MKEEAYTSTHKPLTVGGQAQVTVGTTHISRLTDEQLIKEFLSGSYCLHGVRMDGWILFLWIFKLDSQFNTCLFLSRVLDGGSMNFVMESMSTSIMR